MGATTATLAALFPWELGDKADPFAPAFADIRPEWYFMFMFETLKLVPGGEILGIEFEAIPILLFGILGLAILLVPFLDRGAESDNRSPAFTLLGMILLVYVTGFTAWGYRSWLPVLITLTIGLVVYLHGRSAGRTGRRGE